MDCIWYQITFKEKSLFNDFHNLFKALLANIDDSEKCEVNTIYMPENISRKESGKVFVSIHPTHLDHFQFIKDYDIQKIDKPDGIKYYDGDQPIL
ncbi:MAG: hypothetical protein COT22_02610 [Ignavibacteria bacterium CG08_land_8_20_14_0_20_37_9]|nr:MAG: hypothetical protein COT22_02610 [Ignavibacteria bacterium CG08_land_8_20_14_0_20_37_9]